MVTMFQMDESYSAGNVNPVSPHKDIGMFGSKKYFYMPK